jgi:carboxylesterase
MAKREERGLVRNPETGVVTGAEAMSLGPTAADGATRACLLLHGVVGSRQDFDDLGRRLAEAGFHVRMARLPGHGTSPRDFAGQSADDLYRGALEELRALRGEYAQVDVVGFSMGGALATLLAAEEPVDRLVLAAPYYGVTYKFYYILPPETWNAAVGWAIPYVYRGQSFSKCNRPEGKGRWFAYRSVSTRGIGALMGLGERASRPRTLAEIECPVLLVMGTGDDAASPKRAEAAFEGIASAEKKAVWLARSNHHMFWDWDREEAKSAIVAFLSASDGRGASD